MSIASCEEDGRVAEYPVMAQKYGAGSAQNLRVGFRGQLAFQLEEASS